MKNNMLMYVLIYLLGVVVSSFSQILLKHSAEKKCDKWYQEYLNARVIGAYMILFASTICTIIAFRVLPLSMGPILGTTEYIFVAVLSYIVLKEQISQKKLSGLMLIIIGVLIYSF